MALKRFWADMTWRDFQSAAMREVIAVLPVAAVEQHGPHLPVGVDSVINEGYIRRAARTIPDDLSVLFLPVQSVGVSGEHAAYPGTLTLSVETAIRAWTEIGDSVARSGCRKLIVLSSHGGNGAAVEAVTLHLRMRWAMLAVHASWRRLGYPEGLFSPREMAHGVHGGDAETSLMLALRPDLVRVSEVRDFPSAAEELEKDFALLRAKPPLGFAWAASDLHPEGSVGEADKAAAVKGEAATAHGVERFIALLRDVQAFDLTRLRPGPLEAAP
jgi:creatinine amidohydrolase